MEKRGEELERSNIIGCARKVDSGLGKSGVLS